LFQLSVILNLNEPRCHTLLLSDFKIIPKKWQTPKGFLFLCHKDRTDGKGLYADSDAIFF